jgi:hypothetical protein
MKLPPLGRMCTKLDGSLRAVHVDALQSCSGEFSPTYV